MLRTIKMAAALFAALTLSLAASAQETVFTDASAFPLYGKAIQASQPRYGRLPSELHGVSRDPVWRLGCNSSGLFIRFRSDSPFISARWKVKSVSGMNHMTDTGVSGLDLYALKDGEWRFAGSGRPARKVENTVTLVKDMDGSMREYILYLSLYNSVEELQIGILEGKTLEGPAVEYPSRNKKIVMYGTSILQGGCASRPGMAHTSIIGRMLGHEVINLGFSGNGRLDYEIARLMTQVEDPGVFVLDNVPNCEADLIKEKEETFFHILRDECPDVPIVFVENAVYPHTVFNKVFEKNLIERNAAHRAVYDKMKKAGEKKIFYIEAGELLGDNGEDTVDGVHFTDMGMTHYAEAVAPVIRKALKKNK